MEPKLLKIFVLAFLIYCVSAKRYSGGGGSRTYGSSSRSRPSTSSNRYTPSHSSPSRPSSTSYNSGKTSSSNFLHAESGRPSLPASSYHPPSHSYSPSAPTSNTHNTGFGRPSGVVNERHQQSSAPTSHSNPYERQPAYNPHVTSGHSASPPYPVNQPNHPHPTNIGSSSFPSSGAYHPPSNGAYHPPSNGAYHPPSNGAYHPPSNGAYHPPSNGAYHPPSNGAYHPPSNGAYHPPSSGAYHPPSSGVYQPPVNSAYHPPVNSGYHPSMAGGYHPPMSGGGGGGYHPPTSGGYQPPMSGGYHPPSQSQPHTVYVVPDSRGKSSSGPGLGTYIASGVAGGVAAGATNAIVDHAISSIFRPNSHGVHTYPSAPAPGTPTTSITNNYYYGDGSPDPNGQNNNNNNNNNNNGQPSGQNSNNNYNGQPGQNNNNNYNNGQPGQNNNNYNNGQPGQNNNNNNYNNGQPAQSGGPTPYVPSTSSNQGGVNGAPISGGTVGRPSGVVNRAPNQLAKPDDVNYITDDELMRLSEELFDNLNTNINQYVELNLQKRVAANTNDGPLQDESPEPLFIIKTGLDSLPTVSKLRDLYESYQRNGTQKEIVSSDRLSKENAFMEEVMRTPIMRKTLNWLADKHYVKSNDNEQQKEHLKNMWFTVFKDTSSGFERAFLSENFGESGIAGMQNWIYFAHLEGKNMVDYLSYVDMLSLSGRGALLRVNFRSEGIPMQNVPIFVGTPPELELALYTICMHTRFNGNCPVSLGGAKFFIFTQGFQENNKYMIESGFPLF